MGKLPEETGADQDNKVELPDRSARIVVASISPGRSPVEIWELIFEALLVPNELVAVAVQVYRSPLSAWRVAVGFAARGTEMVRVLAGSFVEVLHVNV